MSSHRNVLSLALALSLVSSATASASPAPTGTNVAPPIATTAPSEAAPGYAWQIVVADLAGLVAAGLLLGVTETPAGLAPMALSAPAVHVVHGEPARAALSLGLHVLAPLAGSLLGYEIDAAGCQPNQWFCGLGGIVTGGLIGYLAATIIDAAWLAGPRRDKRVARQAPRVLPSVAVGPRGMSMGLVGTF